MRLLPYSSSVSLATNFGVNFLHFSIPLSFSCPPNSLPLGQRCDVYLCPLLPNNKTVLHQLRTAVQDRDVGFGPVQVTDHDTLMDTAVKIRIQLLQCTAVYCGVQWFTVVCDSLLWCAMVYCGVRQFTVVCNGLLSCAMVYCGVQQFTVVCNGLLWCAMVSCGVL